MINREANWDVQPESSDNINLGLNYTFPIAYRHRMFIRATGIYYSAKDFIYNAFNSVENKIVARNLLDVSNTGLEAEMRYGYSDFFTGGVNLTYQNIRDRQRYLTDTPADANIPSNTYGERIPNIPYLFGNADASVFFKEVFATGDRLSVGYNMQYVHAFYLYWAKDAAVETKRVIPKQLAHDLQLVYTLKDDRYNISVECKNFTDRKLYDNFSLQKPGRAFFLKLRYFISK